MEDLGSTPGRVIPKTQKILLDNFLLNTQHYKVSIKGNVEQSREMEWNPSLHLGVVAIKKRAFRSALTTVPNFTYEIFYIKYFSYLFYVCLLKLYIFISLKCLKSVRNFFLPKENIS